MVRELYLNIYLTLCLDFMVCELKVLQELRGNLKVNGRIQEGFLEEVTQAVLLLALKSLNIAGVQSCPEAMPLQSSKVTLHTLMLLPSAFLSSIQALQHIYTIPAPFVHPCFSGCFFYN